MYLNQLKCIEVLLNYILYGQDLRHQINNEYHDTETFDKAKNDLFNYVTIDTLIKSYYERPSFSLETFFTKGTIPGKYDEEIKGPVIDLRYINKYHQFYFELVKALTEGNFVFTNNHTVIISSTNIETEVSEEWLYRLAQAYKTSKYQQICLFNKQDKLHINDEEALKKYLLSTKSFFVELTSSTNDLNNIAKKAEENTSQSIDKSISVKVDDIITKFKSYLPQDVNYTIEKYKIPDINLILKEIRKNFPEFYRLPFHKQEEIIKSILLTHKNINIHNNDETQKFLLLLDKNKGYSYQGSTIKKQNVIPGLFNVYLGLLMSLNLDYSNISLSSFNIKHFMSISQQEHLKELNDLIHQINIDDENNKNAKEKIDEIWQEIRNINDLENEGLLIKKNAELHQISAYYKKGIATNSIRAAKRNSLQNLIQYEHENDLNEIAFDNDHIMQLLLECARNGRIYINPLNKKQVILELYNGEIGKTTFKAEINIEKLAAFTSVNNYFLEKTSHSFK